MVLEVRRRVLGRGWSITGVVCLCFCLWGEEGVGMMMIMGNGFEDSWRGRVSSVLFVGMCCFFCECTPFHESLRGFVCVSSLTGVSGFYGSSSLF